MAGRLKVHPRTFADGVMPLENFPEHKRRAIAELVALPKPPARWIEVGLGAIESRAWYEWHWSRGVDPTKKRPAIPRGLRAAVYDRDGHRCLTCGATDDLTLDHIHPFSLGGRDTFDNLQTLCRSCNSRKGARV